MPRILGRTRRCWFMRNVSKFPGLFLALVLIAAGGAAQETESTAPGEIHRYELLVQQPATKDKGMVWWKLAMLYQDAARYADAEHAYKQALRLLQSSGRTIQANLKDQMGTMYVETGRYAEAEQLEQNALALREAQQDALGIGLSWMHLAMLSLGKRQNAEGEMYAELAVERLIPDRSEKAGQNTATPEQKMTALIYLSLARCAARNCVDALAPLKRAMTIADASYPKQSFPVAYITFLEGYARWKRGDSHSAARLMKSGTEGMEVRLGWGHPTYISAMRQYEKLLMQSGHEAEAAEVKQKLLRLPGVQPATQSARAEGIASLR